MGKFHILTACCLMLSLASCQEKPAPDKPLELPPVTVDELFEGEIKAGYPAAVTIRGGEFYEEDYVLMKYTDDEGLETVYNLPNNVLEIRKSRISIGIPVNADCAGKEVVLYLDRPGYDVMPISGKVRIVFPEISEGFIPDPGFRETLMSEHPQEGNPQIAPLFNAYGMLDVDGAAEYVGGINLYNSTAKNLKGIELFKSAKAGEVVVGWNNTSIEEVDLSNFQGEGSVHFQNCPNLKSFKGGPYPYMVNLYACPKLESVDMSHTLWCWNLQLYGNNKNDINSFSTTKLLDIRKKIYDYKWYCYPEGNDDLVDGKYPSDPSFEDARKVTTSFRNDCTIRVSGDCLIRVSEKFVTDRRATDWNKSTFYGGYAGIWYAWSLGATVEVYDDMDMDKLVGTVVPFSENPDALPKERGEEFTIKYKK